MRRHLLFFFLLSGAAAFAQTSVPAQRIDSLVNAAGDLFSGNILVASGGKVVYRKSSGFADWEKKTSLNDSTKFNIGSNGKDFTKVIIAKLIQQKKISADDLLGKYLSGFGKMASEKITIRMLLNMRSGMGDYHMSPRYDPTVHKTIAERTELIKNLPLFFDPGTEEMYSNSGYIVLGAIIEKVCGKSYEEVVKDEIISPLKLRNTVFYHGGMPTVNAAAGCEMNIDGTKFNETEIASAFSPGSDGGMYSSAEDLMLFDQALLFSDKLLDDKHKLLLFSEFGKPFADSWKKMLEDERFVSMLAGGLPGWNSLHVLAPKKKLIVVCLSNYGDRELAAEQMGEAVYQICAGRKAAAIKLPMRRYLWRELNKSGTAIFTAKLDSLLKQNGYELMNGQPLNALGYALLAEGREFDAVAVFKLNLRYFPMNVNLWDSLGEAYYLTGNYAEGIKVFENILRMDDGNERAKDFIAKMKGK